MKNMLIRIGSGLIIAVTLLAFTALAVGAVVDQDYQIPWWTVDGGGGESAGGDYALQGTLGQPDAGQAMQGDDYGLSGGFWVPGASASGGRALYLPLVVR